MMKLKLKEMVTRSLALVLSLCVVSGAWATDYVTVWSQNFDSPSYLTSTDYLNNWSNKCPSVPREGITSSNNGENEVALKAVYDNPDETSSNCLSFRGTSSNTIRGAYYTFPADVFSELTDYVFSFDFYITGGGYLSVQNIGGGTFSFLTLTGQSESESGDDLVVVHAEKAKDESYASLYLKKDWDSSKDYWSACTPSLTGSDGGLLHAGRDVSPNSSSAKYWHRVVIKANKTDGLHVTVTRLSDAKVLLDEKSAGSFTTLKQLNVVSKVGHVAEYIAVDNFVLQTPKVEGAPEAPSIVGVGSGREKTSVTIASETDGAEIYYWIGDGNEDSKVLYNAAFELEESGTVYAYAQNNGIKSTTVSQYFDSNLQAITLAMPAITRRGLTRAYISAPQGAVFGSPTPTIYYKGGSVNEYVAAPAGNTALITMESLDGATIEAKATNARYGDSQEASRTFMSVNAIDGYALSHSVDFVDAFVSNSSDLQWGSVIEQHNDVNYKNLTLSSVDITESWLYYNANADKDGNSRWDNGGSNGLITYNANDNGVILIKGLTAGSLVYVNSSSAVLEPGNMTLTESSGNEYVYTVTVTANVTLKVSNTKNGSCAGVYAIRTFAPTIAEIDGVGYTTLQAAADNAAEGATITLKASTTDGVTLRRGQKLVIGDYTCGTVAGATEYITPTYDEDSKTYTAIETATWVATAAAADWRNADNWNTGTIPSSYTDVVFPAADVAYVVNTIGNGFENGRSECRKMTVNGDVTLKAAGDGWSFVSINGDIDGSGILNIRWTGIENYKPDGTALTISCRLNVENAGNSDSYFNKINEQGYKLTNEVTVNGLLNAFDNVEFSGALVLNNNAKVVVDGGHTITVKDISVTESAVAELSGTFTVSGDVSMGVSSQLTVPEALTFSLEDIIVPTGCIAARDGNVYSVEAAATEATITVDGEVVGGTLTIKDESETVYQSGDKVQVGTTLIVTLQRSTPYRNVTLKVNDVEQTEVANGNITYPVTSADTVNGIVITATGTLKVYRTVTLVDNNGAVEDVAFTYGNKTYYLNKSPYVNLLFDTDGQSRTVAPNVTLKDGYMLTATPEEVTWPANVQAATLTVETAKIVAKVGDTPYASFEEAIANAGVADIVIVDSEAVLPAGYKAVDGKLVQVSYVAQVGDEKYESLAEAVAQADAGETVTLLADTGVDQTIVITKNLTIALGESKTVTANNCRAFWIKSGVVTISGTGKITTGENSSFGDSSSVIRVGDSATNNAAASLTIGKGVEVTTDYCYGVTAFGKNNGISLVVYGTVSVTGTAAAISGNGLSNATSITINDGAVVSATTDAGVYFPCPGTLTVTGGEITGPVGVYVKSGNIEISGGKIKGTAAKAEYKYNTNGLNATGDALVVDSCNYPGAAPQVSVTGGEFTSTSAGAVASYQHGQSAVVENFVSGGTFNTPVALMYCAEGFIPAAADAQGKYGVEAGYIITWVVDGVPAITTVKAGETPTMTDPTKANYEFKDWTPTVVAAAADVTYTATWTANDVTLGTPAVAWGADFTNAVVSATVADGYDDVAYTLTYNSNVCDGTVENGKVTFNVPVAAADRYTDFGYTIDAKVGDSSVGSAKGSAIVADEKAWFSATTDGPTGGAWETTPAVKDGRMTFSESNTFTPTAASSGKIVVINMGKVVFGDTNDTEVNGAQAGIRIGESGKFVVLTTNNTWQETTVDASGTEEYHVVVTINYATRKYSVKVGEATISDIVLAGSETKVSSIEFNGAGSLASLTGEYFEGAMVKDAKGATYDTIEAAIAALNAGTATAPLTLLHPGTAPQGWTIDEDGVLTRASIVVESTDAVTLVAVPVECKADALINLSNRSAGDMLQVNNANGTYWSWELDTGDTGLYWKKVARVGAETDDTPEASACTLKAGAAVWVTRKDATKPIILNATYAAAEEKVEVAVTTGWTLVAPLPKTEAFDLKDLSVKGGSFSDGDMIVIPGEDAPINCVRKDGEWKVYTITVEKDSNAPADWGSIATGASWVVAPKVPAGKGFFFVSEGQKTLEL